MSAVYGVESRIHIPQVAPLRCERSLLPPTETSERFLLAFATRCGLTVLRQQRSVFTAAIMIWSQLRISDDKRIHPQFA